MEHHHETAHTWIAVLLGAIIVGLLFVVAFQALQPKGRLSCRSFGSYEDAKDYYDAGLMDRDFSVLTLDGDKDGIPCEALVK